MRLIDELTLQRELFCRIQENAIDSGTVHFDSYKNWCLSGSEVEKAISDIFSQVDPFCPTIDPEALPIVRELREKLMLTEANQNHFKEERDLLLFKTKETAEAATSEIDRRNKTICELQEKLERVTAERDNLNEEMKKYTQYINTQNPRIGRYEKLYNKIAAGCKLCRGLSSSSGVSPMCENGDPCPLNLDGDHP